MTDIYKEGDHLDIVAGLYKKYRNATYIRPYGSKMCTVKVHGDSGVERNVRLTSVRKSTTTKNDGKDDGYIVMTKDQYNELLNDINELSTALANLQVKARRFGMSR